MSTIANLDVNIRVNAGHLVTQVNTVALKFTWLGRMVNKNLGGIAAKFGSLGGMFGNAMLMAPNQLYFAVEGLKNAFTGAWQAGKGLASAVKGLFSGSVLNTLKGLQEGVRGLWGMFKGVLSTVVELTVAWVKMGLAQFDKMAHERRTAQNLGVKQEFLAALEYKSKLEPKEIEQLMREYERNVTGMTNKNSVVKKAFGEMKLNQEDLVKSGTQEGILQMADAFENLGNDAQKAGINMELFGRRGIRMQQILSGGRKAIEEAAAEAKAMGFAVSEAEGNEVLRAKNAMDEMHMGMEGLGRTAAITIAPFVRMFADMVKEWLKKINEMKPQIINLGQWFEFVFKHMELAWDLAWAKMYLKLQKVWADMMIYVADKFNWLMQRIGLGSAIGMSVNIDSEIKQAAKVKKIQAEFNQQWKKFIGGKAVPNKPQVYEDHKPRDNKAAKRGSLEAYKVIIGAEDKASKQRYAQIDWLKKIHNKVEKQHEKRQQQRVRRGRV